MKVPCSNSKVDGSEVQVLEWHGTLGTEYRERPSHFHCPARTLSPIIFTATGKIVDQMIFMPGGYCNSNIAYSAR